MDRPHPIRRRAVLALLALAALPLGAQPRPGGLPQTNLRIEWREVDASATEAHGAEVEGGSVVVESGGRIDGRAGVRIDARRSTSTQHGARELLVLNGGRGALHLGSDQPVQWLQIGWSADGPVVLGGGAYVATGRSVTVQPRWPGGDAPVTLELSAASTQPVPAGQTARHAADGQPLPDGSLERGALLTTLALPLGRWITVAQSGTSAERSERGTFATRESAGRSSRRLELRVSLP